MRSKPPRLSSRHTLLATLALFAGPAWAAEPAPWLFFGNDISNTRGHLSGGVNVGAPFQINPQSAKRLTLKWSTSTVGDISATPTVDASGVYFPDYAGFLYRLDPNDGHVVWSRPLSQYMGGTYGYSRSSPAIGTRNEVVIGNNSVNESETPGARVLSVNKTDGALNWLSVIDSDPNAFVTGSPVIYGGRVYVGVVSNEEARATRAGFVPNFRGSVVALDEASGRLLWKFYTVPRGYTGAAVWGGNPVIFPQTRSVIVSTGNNYSVPANVSACFQAAGPDLRQQYACMDPSNFVNSVLALDLDTGRLNWARRFEGADTWTLACSLGPQSACPSPAGIDRDFAQAPSLVQVPDFAGVTDDRGGTSNDHVMGVGQKSGRFWALNPYNGGLFWSTFVGRGDILWGSAVDTDDRAAFFTALNNRAHYSNVLAGQNGVRQTWNAGAWSALDLRTGRFRWQVKTYGADRGDPSFGGAAPGPVTFTNRVLFGGSTSGYFVGLDATSGRTLWTYDAGGPIIGGPAVYNETLYWGAGATRSGPGSVHRMFAFAVPRN